MKLRGIAAISLLVLSSFAATTVAPTKAELETMYDKAFRAFDANHYDDALKALDAIDARQPGRAESENLRGAVLMRKGDYEKAESALRKALDLDPKFWNASFNLAEIPFLKKDWTEARNRFEALIAASSEPIRPETKLLIQYKILLTFVLQGRENMVALITTKFEAEKDSPALYYAKAAIALQHDNQKEAKIWIDAATKHYPVSLNKLFAESLYEIGWMAKPAGESRTTVGISSTAERMKADAQANFEKAELAFQQRDFPATLKLLDLADEGAPNQAALLNLRGEVFMEEKKFDEAENQFRKAFTADPKFREAQYNLAQIPFKEKDYKKSRERLEALFGETPGGDKNQAAQLIKYKIYMTLLLEGNDAQAQQMMDQFKFTGDTPALYYAQAAWSFNHGNADQGNNWVNSARKIYPPALNIVFADAFYDLGWLQHAPATPPVNTEVAQANSLPITGPTPEMRFSNAGGVPARIPAAAQPTNSPTAAAPTTAASSIPPVASQTVAPAIAKATQQKSAIIPNSAAVSPAATALEPARIREYSQPNFAELMDRISEPRTLLVCGLLMAGVILLGWLIWQLVRRHATATPSLYETTVPLGQPRFAGPAAPTIGSNVGSGDDERSVTHDLLKDGPPKIPLDLKGSEPAVRSGVLPSGAIGAPSTIPASEEPAPVSPNERGEFVPEVSEVSEVKPIPATIEQAAAEVSDDVERFALPAVLPNESEAATENTPPRDEEEVSLAAADVDEAVSEPVPMPIASIEEPIFPQEEPIDQRQPISQLTSFAPSEPVMSELTEPETTPVKIEPPTAAAAAIAGGHAARRSSVETPSFASKIITTQSTAPPSTIAVIMPDRTPLTAIDEPRPASASTTPRTPAASAASEPTSTTMQTAVQLTFALEISSLKLTPTFKMGSLQVKPVSNIVAMRLAPSAQPQPAMNMQVTFELSSVQLGAGASLGTVRLIPSSAQRPTPVTSPSFEISGLQLVSGSAAAPVQLTPTHQAEASVLMTANFQIATVEFSPSFEIASVVLNSTSKNVAMQLPGAGSSSIEAAPVFEISNVQLSGGSEIGMIQLSPLGGGSGRRA